MSVFVDDINETVREHNKNAKSEDDMIKYELISGLSSTSWFVNLLPTIIMGVLLVILLCHYDETNEHDGRRHEQDPELPAR